MHLVVGLHSARGELSGEPPILRNRREEGVGRLTGEQLFIILLFKYYYNHYHTCDSAFGDVGRIRRTTVFSVLMSPLASPIILHIEIDSRRG